MATLQQLKGRIKSIKSTSQLTKAMQTVAAIRYKKNSAKSKYAHKHLNQMKQLEQTLQGHLPQHDVFQSRPKATKTLLLIVGPTRGFCGGLHRSIPFAAYKSLKEDGIDPQDSNQVEIITINKPALKNVSRQGGTIYAAFLEITKDFDEYDILALSELILKKYKEDKTIRTVKATFLTLDGKVTTETIFPLSTKNNAEFDENQRPEHDYRFDSSVEDIGEELIHQYLQSFLNLAVIQTQTSEEKARMIAMNQATENAKKMNQALQLSFFRMRQAKITQEMNEIASNLS